MANACPTGKCNHRSARGALVALAKNIQHGRPSTRIYKCNLCPYWHVTKKPARGRWRDASAHGGLMSMLTLPGHDNSA